MTKIFNLLFVPIYALAIYVHSVILSKNNCSSKKNKMTKIFNLLFVPIYALALCSFCHSV